jgi:hypothetical protein
MASAAADELAYLRRRYGPAFAIRVADRTLTVRLAPRDAELPVPVPTLVVGASLPAAYPDEPATVAVQPDGSALPPALIHAVNKVLAKQFGAGSAAALAADGVGGGRFAGQVKRAVAWLDNHLASLLKELIALQADAHGSGSAGGGSSSTATEATVAAAPAPAAAPPAPAAPQPRTPLTPPGLPAVAAARGSINASAGTSSISSAAAAADAGGSTLSSWGALFSQAWTHAQQAALEGALRQALALGAGDDPLQALASAGDAGTNALLRQNQRQQGNSTARGQQRAGGRGRRGGGGGGRGRAHQQALRRGGGGVPVVDAGSEDEDGDDGSISDNGLGSDDDDAAAGAGAGGGEHAGASASAASLHLASLLRTPQLWGRGAASVGGGKSPEDCLSRYLLCRRVVADWRRAHYPAARARLAAAAEAQKEARRTAAEAAAAAAAADAAVAAAAAPPARRGVGGGRGPRYAQAREEGLIPMPGFTALASNDDLSPRRAGAGGGGGVVDEDGGGGGDDEEEPTAVAATGAPLRTAAFRVATPAPAAAAAAVTTAAATTATASAARLGDTEDSDGEEGEDEDASFKHSHDGDDTSDDDDEEEEEEEHDDHPRDAFDDVDEPPTGRRHHHRSGGGGSSSREGSTSRHSGRHSDASGGGGGGGDDDDDEDVDTQLAPAFTGLHLKPAHAGTQLLLEGLSLYGIGSLAASRLAVNAQCGRCAAMVTASLRGVTLPGAASSSSSSAPDAAGGGAGDDGGGSGSGTALRTVGMLPASLHAAPAYDKAAEYKGWCGSCSLLLSLYLRPTLIHEGSRCVGYVDASHATVTGLADASLFATCLECGGVAEVPHFAPPQAVELTCRVCFSRMRLAARGTEAVPATKETAASAASAGGAPRKIQRFTPGRPLPLNGACTHYKRSYRWLRFPCCQRAFPCDVCHDEASDHPHDYALRMVSDGEARAPAEEAVTPVGLFSRPLSSQYFTPAARRSLSALPRADLRPLRARAAVRQRCAVRVVRQADGQGVAAAQAVLGGRLRAARPPAHVPQRLAQVQGPGRHEDGQQEGGARRRRRQEAARGCSGGGRRRGRRARVATRFKQRTRLHENSAHMQVSCGAPCVCCVRACCQCQREESLPEVFLCDVVVGEPVAVCARSRGCW